MSSLKYLFILNLIIAIHGLNIMRSITCRFYECCGGDYYENIDNLEKSLENYVFGQPLACKTLISALKSHFHLEKPRKALVLSFHGLTGTGKSYVAKFIAENLLQMGIESKFYEFFRPSDDLRFKSVHERQEYILRSIRKTVEKCKYSVFVFDETDKIKFSLIDTIKHFVEFDAIIDGYDYRNCIFLILSNRGGKAIAEFTLELEQIEIPRDKFEIRFFEKIIYESVNNTSEQDHHYLVDYYIPFLPLDQYHIKLCIISEFKRYGISQNNYPDFDEYAGFITNELVYEPHGLKSYSSSGCKHINTFVRKFICQKDLLKKKLKEEL